MATDRVQPEHFLHPQCECGESTSHVSIARRQPYPHVLARRKRNHRSASRPRTIRTNASTSTSRPTTTRRPFALTTSIRPASCAGTALATAAASDTITAGTNPPTGPSPSRPSRHALRHVCNCQVDIPCRRAVADTCRGPAQLSATIRSFASSVQRRRRPISTTSSRCTTPLSI